MKIKTGLLISAVSIGSFFLFKGAKKINPNTVYQIGQPIDSLSNVVVYYNGGVDNVTERNTLAGYNIGLKYQCVEFVKRYYLEKFNHKMPDTYGHAKSFFNPQVLDGEMNEQRALTQYTNPSQAKPKTDDLLVMKGTLLNKFGHVAIVSKVEGTEVEIIQQNPGPFAPSREKMTLKNTDEGKWLLENERVLGWLRKQ